LGLLEDTLQRPKGESEQEKKRKPGVGIELGNREYVGKLDLKKKGAGLVNQAVKLGESRGLSALITPSNGIKEKWWILGAMEERVP